MSKPYGSSPVTDPDQMAFEVDVSYIDAVEELIINTSAKTIALKVVGNLTTDGATLKAVYSKIKDAWLANATLIKFDFPMQPITDEQFELINGWNWDKVGSSGLTLSTASWASDEITYTTSAAHGISIGDVITVTGVTPTGYNGTYVTVTGTTGSTIVVDELVDPGTYSTGGTVANYLTTPGLIRTGGWAVVNANGNNEEIWTGVVTLGALGSTDQVYYQQNNEAEAPVDFLLTNNVNQAVQVYRDDNADAVPDFDYRTYFKIFVREYEKLYAQSAIADIGITTLASQAYRYPLTNAADLKIQVTTANLASELDANLDGTPDVGDYAKIDITYLRDSNGDVYTVLGNYNPASTAYVIGDVVKDTGNNRWYDCIVGYTSDATQPSANATNWQAYEGERLIGTTYYPFTIIVDADNTVGPLVGGSVGYTKVYTGVQYELAQNVDIDDGTGTVTGKTANALLTFVGDQLVTQTGVYIDSFSANDTNSLTFTDATGVTGITFPFVASLTVNFGTNLQNDSAAKYWVFFTNANGNQFGTSNAIIVQDNDDVDMAGTIGGATSISHTFDYDGNVQGGRTPITPAPITAVGIGLVTGQYVVATETINRSTANAVTLTASFERNYDAGTV